MTPRLWVRARRISRRWNALLGGNPNHCLSTRIHGEERHALIFLVNVIFLPWGWHHCRYSYERETRNEEACPYKSTARNAKKETGTKQADTTSLETENERGDPKWTYSYRSR